MTTDRLGLYVHIPFCVSKCKYCDFASFARVDSQKRRAYVDRLCNEIEAYSGTEKRILDTVFFGGGTPSLLAADELVRIFEAINKSFEILPEAEVTLEANPKTLTEEFLLAARACGVNRISLGLQSIHENELKFLGRIHLYDDFLASYEMVKKAGIDNINVDLMYGIPEQTKETFEKTLHTVARLSPKHISAYGLIIEDGTPFFKMRDSLPLPSEDDEADMYYMAADILSSYGYKHYEISNYAKDGYESRHNLKYWHDEEYIGVGLSAHSYLDSYRYSNTLSFDEYLCGSGVKYECKNELSSEDTEYEYAMMRLRLREGIDLYDYIRRFGHEFSMGREALIEKFESAGLIKCADGRLSLTEQGFYLSNTILSELL